MVGKQDNIRCGWCDSKSTAEKWNENSYKECKSREMRRAYTDIYKYAAYRVGANTFYKCPACSSWSRGCQLAVVDTNDVKLLKLGRKPVIDEVDSGPM